MIELRLRLGAVDGHSAEQVHGTVAPAESRDMNEPVPFVGWLDLLSVLERYVEPANDASGGEANA